LAPILKLLPPQRRPQLRSAVLDLEPRLRWWLIGSLIAMGATGLATWICYSLIGLQFAGPLALLAGEHSHHD
jgi:predicted PurR-regulated permease PerM